jgi:hypothetical protein
MRCQLNKESTNNNLQLRPIILDTSLNFHLFFFSPLSAVVLNLSIGQKDAMLCTMLCGERKGKHKYHGLNSTMLCSRVQ